MSGGTMGGGDDDDDDLDATPFVEMEAFFDQLDVVVLAGKAAGAGSTITLKREISTLDQMRPKIGDEFFDVARAKNLADRIKKWGERKTNEVDVWMKETVESLGSNMDDFRDFLEKKDHYLELDERVDSLLKEVNGLRSRMALQDLEDVIENEEMEVDTSGLGLFGDNAEAIKKLEEELEESKLECTKLREDLKVCVAERDENAARLKVCVAERDKDIAKFAKLEEDFKVCVEERDENAAKSIKLQEEIDTLRAASSDSLEKEKNNKKKRQREEEATSEEASQRPSKQPTTMSSSYQSLLSAMTAMSQELSDAQTNNENLKKEFNSKLLKLKNECEELRGREDKNVAMTEYDDAIIKMEALLKIHERIVSSSLMKVRVEVGNNAELSKRVVALTKDKKKAIARKEEYKNVWLQLKANEAGFKAEKAGLLVKLDEANKSIKTFERNRDLMKSIADVIVSVGSEEGMPLMLTKTTLDMAISQAKMSDRENGVARDEYDSDLGEGEDAGEEEREDTMDAEKDE